jgi:hypothetical protein
MQDVEGDYLLERSLFAAAAAAVGTRATGELMCLVVILVNGVALFSQNKKLNTFNRPLTGSSFLLPKADGEGAAAKED